MYSIPSNEVRQCKNHLSALKAKYPAAVLDYGWQTPNQLTITVGPEYLVEAVSYMYYERYGWISVVVANDERPLNGNYAMYYLMSMEGREAQGQTEEDRGFVIIRCEVDPHTLEYPSVTPKVPACVWGERESRDMFGLIPVGLPDRRRLVLPDDWPEGLYPLRKDAMDYRHRPDPTTDDDTYQFIAKNKGKNVTISPMGPLHVMNDEPGHFRLFVDGENIIDADYRMFYVHRGMEKVAESRMDYNQVTFLTDRVCGICGFAHSVAYCESVENALGVHIPERAHVIRAILLETERLHSHLLNIGLVCHFCGFDSGFMQFFRVREKAMDLAEILTGARKTYGLNLIGGVRRDILAEQRISLLTILHELKQEVTDLIEVLVSTPNFEQRTAGVGVLDPQVARDFSPVGPCVRGSGLKRDARWDHPFAGYKYIADKHGARVHTGNDCKSRTLVRIEEFFDSIEIIEQLLDIAPQGPILTEDFEYVPHRFALGVTEAPRGEDVHWSMLGDNQKVYRWRCKAATYSNWPVLRYMLRGNTVADAPLIVGSIDPCYSCTDRVTFVDVHTAKETTVSKDEFERYGREKKHSPLKQM